MTRIDHRIEPRAELARDATTGCSTPTSALYPATAPILRPLGRGRVRAGAEAPR